MASESSHGANFSLSSFPILCPIHWPRFTAHSLTTQISQCTRVFLLPACPSLLTVNWRLTPSRALVTCSPLWWSWCIIQTWIQLAAIQCLLGSNIVPGAVCHVPINHKTWVPSLVPQVIVTLSRSDIGSRQTSSPHLSLLSPYLFHRPWDIRCSFISAPSTLIISVSLQCPHTSIFLSIPVMSLLSKCIGQFSVVYPMPSCLFVCLFVFKSLEPKTGWEVRRQMTLKRKHEGESKTLREPEQLATDSS